MDKLRIEKQQQVEREKEAKVAEQQARERLAAVREQREQEEAAVGDAGPTEGNNAPSSPPDVEHSATHTENPMRTDNLEEERGTEENTELPKERFNYEADDFEDDVEQEELKPFIEGNRLDHSWIVFSLSLFICTFQTTIVENRSIGCSSLCTHTQSPLMI